MWRKIDLFVLYFVIFLLHFSQLGVKVCDATCLKNSLFFPKPLVAQFDVSVALWCDSATVCPPQQKRLEPIVPISRVPCPACCSMKEVTQVVHWKGSQSWQ